MITIAIDGYSACGKSTLAKEMARQLSYRYIDSGAMYRAVTLYMLRQQTDLDDPQAVAAALRAIQIDFDISSGANHTLLNGEDVELEIRGMAVSSFVSPVAAISAVRKDMVAQQRRLGAGGGVIMDGRDIGTVVFPDAALKIFVTAAMDVRVERRLSELLQSGKQATAAEVRENLAERDRIDSSRADSPLKLAEDAFVLDNSNLSFAAFVDAGMQLAKQAGA